MNRTLRRAALGLVTTLGNNEKVIEMTEPQVWVLIGVFAAAFFSLIGIVTTNFNRTMIARFQTIDARFQTIDARFESLETRIDAKFDIINMKLENMDRDIQALSRHVFGTDPR